ncbi:Bug family tripartite tricarboxylate transporter substrate binding protein [Pelomonas aquatica]|jgi:tripartite-type tricarboxylate transporter receptor subunit TctC|uniref:Tripartite tricarboxylate transporter substrate binding protein n=1 Tax=Pelomonas aquatica TaxID=431058 RepID=A0A9X4LES0_9BURK|nr:tripartite tricarboxylate transporter substrate binding protein [Pelomonas aquatica]MCY4752928.1 tripartite tricarboxylate transporter substrate binding protein [Pelomonas aquatica]MDG0862130.1 tripartite tricarboxylate transporter substrate binding protein [Pelomonas aquatica]
MTRPPGTQRRSLLLWLAGTSVAAAQPGAAHAWPSRPLRIVVPYMVKGATDMAARLLAPELQRSLGQPVFVENRPGAQGKIGSAEVAGAGDGHTLLMGSAGTHVINPLLSGHLPYDPVKDFAPVCLVATMPLVLVVNPAVARSLDIHSVDDLVRVAAARPGRLLVASGGNGNATHLAGELFKRMTQTFMLHFPYRSNSPARQDVVAGNMDLMFDNLPAALAQIRAGKLRALAVTSVRRSPSLPEVPTIEEAGGPALKGYEASAWAGLFAPGGQPPEQLARLQHDAVAALAQPALRERMSALGLQPQGSGAGEFAALIAAETVKWARVIELSGVKVDR